MTDIDILKDAVASLGAIQVPVCLFQEIGAPIARVRNNLSELQKAIISQAEAEKKEPHEESQN